MKVIILSVFALFSGLGVFMTGMKQMREGLSQGMGNGVKKALNKISDNRLLGLGLGAGVTVITNSSSATVLMTIGLVNAGAMTLLQAAAIILGANVGTTITGLISAFSAFDASLYFSVLSFVGIAIISVAKKPKWQRIGQILGGFGLMFIGLNLMGSSFNNNMMQDGMEIFFTSIKFPLLLLLFSMIITALIQSSTAVVGACIAMVGAGALRLEYALFIVLGADVGTCFTAIIASQGASLNARRVAYIQLFFNLFGTALFMVIVWVFKAQIVYLLEATISTPSFRIAVFHATFNIITAIICLPFLNKLVNFVIRIVRNKNDVIIKKKNKTTERII